ncbi:sulfotransferase family protein [Virgibacillus kekensis]|uniref:Sulfotransferase family protein n=1 Tax=Virgibacillus kekensis TaxID=202261 RepID=A0ABV9DIV2_9BACI
MHQSPIFLIGNHKSGTSLLRSLLDSHEDLFVIPNEIHPFKHLGYWIDYDMRKNYPKQLSVREKVRNFKEWIEYSNQAFDKYADSDTRNIWDLDLLNNLVKQRLETDQEISDKDLVDFFLETPYQLIQKKPIPQNKRIVEKSVEHGEFAADLQKMYPHAKFVHIIRNPYSNLVSIRKYIGRNKFPFLRDPVNALYNSYYYLEKNQRIIDNYFVIRYEDLLTKPDETISEIAEFLGIPNQNSLYQPSSLGGNWAGNSTNNVEFKGISAKNINSWKTNITDIEIKLVNKLFSQILSKYNYEKLEPSESFWKRDKAEDNLKSYIGNRLFPRFYLK